MNKNSVKNLMVACVTLLTPITAGHSKLHKKKQTKETISLGYNQEVVIKNGRLDLSYRNLNFDYEQSWNFLHNIISQASCLKHPIRHLDLTGNKIRSLPESVGALTSLESLKLADNPLRRIPNKTLIKLTKLRLLILPDNQTGQQTIQGHELVQRYLGRKIKRAQHRPIPQRQKSCCQNVQEWVLWITGCSDKQSKERL